MRGLSDMTLLLSSCQGTMQRMLTRIWRVDGLKELGLHCNCSEYQETGADCESRLSTRRRRQKPVGNYLADKALAEREEPLSRSL
jgi:hypothetical protein